MCIRDSSNMTQTDGIETSFQNNTVTETDNVADGPKHYSISISEGLIIGDGTPTNTQTQNEPVFEEILKDVQISESVSFSDTIGEEEKSRDGVNISESVSFSDRLEAIIILPYGVIRINETISFTDETEVGFGLELIKISESVSLSDNITVESHRTLNAIVDVSESIEFSSQIAIDGIIELQINEFLIMYATVGIYPSIIRIDEHLQLSDYEAVSYTHLTLPTILLV